MANDEGEVREVQVAYRISESQARTMDKEIERWERDHPGVRLSRAEYSRMMILKGMSDAAATRAEIAKRKAG